MPSPVRNRSLDLAAIVCGVAILAIAHHFLSAFKANVVAIGFAALYVAISSYWVNRSKVWFWLVVGSAFLAHLLVAIFVDAKLPEGPALTYVAPALFADGFLLVGIMRLFERRKTVE